MKVEESKSNNIITLNYPILFYSIPLPTYSTSTLCFSNYFFDTTIKLLITS